MPTPTSPTHARPAHHGNPPSLLRINALAALDAQGTFHSPASVILQIRPSPAAATLPTFEARLLAIGTPRDVDAHEAARSPGVVSIDRPNAVLIPGLVNAHTHLDLTHIGPVAHDPAAGFVSWVQMVRDRRHAQPTDIAQSVRMGIELSLSAGVVAVGDIAGAPMGKPTLAPLEALRTLGMPGRSFIEFFAIGNAEARGLSAIAAVFAGLTELPPGPTFAGLQPHAPTTVSLTAFERACELARSMGLLPLSTHLAETPDEHEFIATGTGPHRAFLESLNLWNDALAAQIGHGLHPVAHVEPAIAKAPFVCAHVNDADDRAIEILARTRATVVYCPRASTYFNASAHFGPHRYRDMLAAGVPVALGTDSIINLPPEAAFAPPTGRGMSILDEMRHLFARDGTDPATLLTMATTTGATALGLDPLRFAFTVSPSHAWTAETVTLAGLVAVSPRSPAPGVPPAVDRDNAFRRIVSDAVPELLFAENAYVLTRSAEH